MKITARVTKSLHQDHGLCYLLLLNFFLLHIRCTLLWQNKKFQLYILKDYSSVGIGFNMPHAAFNIHHVSLNMLSFNHYCFTQDLNEVNGSNI